MITPRKFAMTAIYAFLTCLAWWLCFGIIEWFGIPWGYGLVFLFIFGKKLLQCWGEAGVPRSEEPPWYVD